MDSYLRFLIDLYKSSIIGGQKFSMKYSGFLSNEDHSDKQRIQILLSTLENKRFLGNDDYKVEDFYYKHMNTDAKINALNNYIEQNRNTIIEEISKKFS